MEKGLFFYLCQRKYAKGTIAQLVEQRTENPCVPGSIPGGTTGRLEKVSLFCFYPSAFCYKTGKYYFCDIDWRRGRVDECGGLENRCPPWADRGFESLRLRNMVIKTARKKVPL